MFLVNTIIQSLLQDHFTGEMNTGRVLKIQWELGIDDNSIVKNSNGWVHIKYILPQVISGHPNGHPMANIISSSSSGHALNWKFRSKYSLSNQK